MKQSIRAIATWIIVLSGLLSLPAQAQFNNTTPRGTFAGTHNYVVTGGTLRAASNNSNACSLNSSSTAPLAGIPAGSTILGAYLYWGGSGTSGDYTVTFGPAGATASRTASGGNQFSAVFNEDGYNFSFFGAFFDATSIVAGKSGGPNGNYSFSGLSVTNTGAYCTNQTTLAAWALVVVYSNPSERYRYTRVYDGLQYFRGSSVTTTQSGFRVPDLLDGKVTTVTWEGDPDTDTSFPIGTFTEALSFDGHQLINMGCDGTNNLYNSTLNPTGSSCTSTNYGADVDTYDITNYLYEGQTGATLEYSSGNDLVLLTAQVISTTNTPVADLGITKTHNGSFFTAGQNGSYNIVVHNYGPEIATGTATVTDTLPTGLTFVSGTGTGWTCSAVNEVVTCNNSQTTLAVGANLPTLTLTVAVDGMAAASTQNTATVSHPMFDGTGGNQTSTDTVTVRRSSLSTSSKSVVDQNGGSVQPGDVLRYTITLINTGDAGVAATGVSVLDDLADNLGNLQIVSIPAGAVDSSIGSGGINGTGRVQVSGITVPAGGSVSVVFDATVSLAAGPGDTIDNSATINNPGGTGATPSAPQQTIPDPTPPISGNKLLYLLTGPVGSTRDLTRTRPTSDATMAWTRQNAQYHYFYLPPLAKPLVLNDDTISVTLRGRRITGTQARTLRARVYLNTTGNDISGNSGNMNFNVANFTNRTENLDLDQTTFAVGDRLILRVEHNTNSRIIELAERESGNYSYITLDAQTVINVDTVKFYDAPYPATTTKTQWEAGDTVYIRADISDPFGGFDVSATNSTLTLADADGGPLILNAVTMTPMTNPAEGDGVPNRILERAYTLPTGASVGTWTASVTGSEGSEDTIRHTRSNTFDVVPKGLSVVKSHSGDFIAGANNVYTLTVNNTGGTTVSGTTTVKDTLPTGLGFVSGTGTGWTCSAAGQVVTCASTASVVAGNSMAPIALTVFVAGNMGNSVANQASVGNSTINGGAQKPGNVDTAIIRHPDLSTSTKSVADLNGGDANPGDTLRYSLNIVESSGYEVNNASVSDTIPALLTGLAGVNTTLTTCSGTPSVIGSTLTVTGINLSGGASCAIVFDVQVSGSAGAGSTIVNTATITNPGGPGATPSSPTVTVSQSQVVIPGGKILYVYANNTMTRVPQTGTGTNTVNQDSYQDFILAGVANPLVIAPGSTIGISLWLQRSGNTTTTDRTVYARLFKNGSTQIGGTSNSVTFNSTTLALQSFTITAPSFGTAGNLDPGDTLVLRVYNDSGTGGSPRTVGFSQRSGTTNSTLTISTPTVVNVGSVDIYSAAYPSTAQAGAYGQGDTIYVRATVTDPFGFADISGGSVAIKNPGGTTIHTAALVNGTHSKSTSGATRIYEYPYTIPASPPVGGWTASVTANEGSEGTITHTGNGGFSVGGTVTLRKVWGPGATAGHAVTLTISGGTGAVAGSSTAPSTLTPATSNAATGAIITLTEAFTTGAPGGYTVTLTCQKDSDLTTVTPSGTGLSRTITMPAGSVTCTFTNGVTVPLSIVKLNTVYSDPVNGTTNPKAIPGALVTYVIIVTAPAETQVDADSIVISDAIPPQTVLFVDDLPDQPGTSPFGWLPNASNLTFTFGGLGAADDVDFSNDGGASWSYVPVPDGSGVDAAVTNVRFNPKGSFAPGQNFWLGLRVKVK